MIGQERTVLPLLAEREFHLTAFTAALTFIVAFGAVKAATNFFAGTLSDRYGRKPVLVAGWLIGIPVPLLLIWAPTWGWIIVANVLLGVNQGLTWSTTVIMKIDLAGPERRGLAMGLNEAAGYGAVAVTALATGFIAADYGLRPEPFFLGIAYAGLGLGLSALFVRETRGHAHHEAATPHRRPTRARVDPRGLHAHQLPRTGAVVVQPGRAGQQPQRRPRLGPVPAAVRAARLERRRIGILAALYPAVWGLGQLVTGALSDRMGPQAAHRRRHAHPGRRHRCRRDRHLRDLGARRRHPRCRHRHGVPDPARRHRRRRPPGLAGLRRSASTGCGATAASPSARSSPGSSPTRSSITAAIWTVAALTAASGLVVAVRMYETYPAGQRGAPDTNGAGGPNPGPGALTQGARTTGECARRTTTGRHVRQICPCACIGWSITRPVVSRSSFWRETSWHGRSHDPRLARRVLDRSREQSRRRRVLGALVVPYPNRPDTARRCCLGRGSAILVSDLIHDGSRRSVGAGISRRLSVVGSPGRPTRSVTGKGAKGRLWRGAAGDRRLGRALPR